MDGGRLGREVQPRRGWDYLRKLGHSAQVPSRRTPRQQAPGSRRRTKKPERQSWLAVDLAKAWRREEIGDGQDSARVRGRMASRCSKPFSARCRACGGRLRYRYDNRHTVSTLAGLVRPRLRIRRCEDPGCARCRRPYRPEAEGALVLPPAPVSAWTLIALLVALCIREHQSVPEIHRGLRERGVAIAERTVTHLLDRRSLSLGGLSPTGGTSWWRPVRGRRRPAAGGPGRAGAGDPGARRPPAGRRPRGPVGRARVPVGRGPARQEPAVLDGRGPGGAAARGHRRHSRRADRRGGQRRPALGAAGGRAGAARGAAPAVPVPLPARGGAGHPGDRHADGGR